MGPSLLPGAAVSANASQGTDFAGIGIILPQRSLGGAMLRPLGIANASTTTSPLTVDPRDASGTPDSLCGGTTQHAVGAVCLSYPSKVVVYTCDALVFEHWCGWSGRKWHFVRVSSMRCDLKCRPTTLPTCELRSVEAVCSVSLGCDFCLIVHALIPVPVKRVRHEPCPPIVSSPPLVCAALLQSS